MFLGEEDALARRNRSYTATAMTSAKLFVLGIDVIIFR